MKNNLIFVILILAIGTSYGQVTKVTNKSFPTNFDQSKFNKIKEFTNEMIAYDGKILEIKNSRNNTPFYKLELGEDSYLWTVLMFKNEDNLIGDKIRVVGYLNKIDQKDANEEYLTGEKYMVMALGLVDFENENFLFVSSGYKQKQQWIKGEIPGQ
ncbi:hypothetical protein [Winogradskyella helgolandensis]|uniref:hypothetical protein n=1 Tax=Winogradskyella helgolandensis TaxID=2697010 RepID=UPI0015CDDD03|nr:hypothetical protein [Winogradskyella helgolandensis]